MSSTIGRTCPYCQFPIKPEEPYVVCTKCGMFHHTNCWRENRECTTFGCDGQPVQASRSANLNRPSGNVDLTEEGIICPQCGGKNPLNLRSCKYCGNDMSNVLVQPPPPSAGKICGNCGADNPVQESCCFRCGAFFPQVNSVARYHPFPGQHLPQYPPQYPLPGVPNYLWQAILCTLCCCQIGGIVAIVYAVQVDAKLQAGDYNGAIAASRNAAIWCWVSFGIGCAVSLIYLLAVMGDLP